MYVLILNFFYLIGASPFSAGLSALPFGHLAHLPSAFSMLGHPAFPVSSLFGRLDGLSSPLGSPASLPTSLTASSGKILCKGEHYCLQQKINVMTFISLD